MKDKKRCKLPMSPYRDLTDTFVYAGRLHRMVLERLLNKTGVHRGQHQLLMYIADNPNISQKEIARLNKISPATVAVSLKKLEQAGYIRRAVDAEDNRYNQICITPKGSAVVEKSVSFFLDIESRMFEGLAPEELENLKHSLKQIQNNLITYLPEEER